MDAFARFTMGVALVAIIISIFFPGGNRIGALFDTIGFLALLYTYYRMLSRDIQKRYAENEKYLAATAKFRQRFNWEKKYDEPEKDPSYLFMSGCGQKIRIPKRQKARLKSNVRNVIRNLSKEADKLTERYLYVWVCGAE